MVPWLVTTELVLPEEPELELELEDVFCDDMMDAVVLSLENLFAGLEC